MAKAKILKTGETDIESTDIWRYAVHSDYPNIKIKFSGSAEFTMTNGSFDAYHEVTHNLGYIPQLFAWVETSGGKIFECPVLADLGVTSSGPVTSYAYAFATNNVARIGVANRFPVDALADDDFTFTAHWRIAVDNF